MSGLIQPILTQIQSFTDFLNICFDKIINQYSSQPKEFCYFWPPIFEMIVKANSILTSEPYPFTNG